MIKTNFKDLNFYKKIITRSLVFLFFLIISFFILKNIFLMNGLISGGDWSLPLSYTQIDKFCENYGNTWSTSNNLLGNKSIATNIFPFLLIFKAALFLSIY